VLVTLWVGLTDTVADSVSVRVEDDEAVIVTEAETQLDADREKLEDAVTDGLIDVERETVFETLWLGLTEADAERVRARDTSDELVLVKVPDDEVDGDREIDEEAVDDGLVVEVREAALDLL